MQPQRIRLGHITKAVGLEKGVKGWRAVYYEIQGETIIKKEYLGTDSAKAIAVEELKVAVIRKVLASDS